MTKRCGYVAIIGLPNAGKSTLLNKMMGNKLAIVTPKPQTTRNRIMGVMTHQESQIILVDTPGIFNARQRFEKAMVQSAWNGAAEADKILLLVDVEKGMTEPLANLLALLQQKKEKKFILALNKIDACNKMSLLALTSELSGYLPFEHVFMVSARKGDGVEDITHYLAETMPEGMWLYPEDQMTDVPERVLAAEITREKLFMKLNEELPYAITVHTESWKHTEHAITIHQNILVQRESQKMIVVGKNASMLKEIGASARKEMEHLWDTKVHLFLFVKVDENWKEDPEIYHGLGLDF